MSCPNTPADGNRSEGVCHVCAMRERLPAIIKIFAGKRGKAKQHIRFCPMCCHWFCEECWGNVMGRITGFTEQYLREPDGCCGP